MLPIGRNLPAGPGPALQFRIAAMTGSTMVGRNVLFNLSLASLMLGLTAVSQAENWPRFRGPDGLGLSEDESIPAKWTSEEVAWVTDLPGVGHSSPVIWGDAAFVTSATDEGKSRTLYCLDAVTGAIRWSKTENYDTNKLHAKNSFATSSPATDGERVYVPFADDYNYSLSAYDYAGELVWKKSLGTYKSQHGLGVSPIVFEDLVFMPNDQDGPSSVVAFDRRDGKVVWTAEREAREASYSTPIIVEQAGLRPQLVCVSGATGMSSLDPWTGELNWKTAPLPQRTVASPAKAGGLIFVTCGQGGKGTRLIGVDPGGQGDVEESHIKVRRDKGLPYVPTIIGYGDWIFFWNDNGVVSCVDVRTLETHWEKRIGGNFSGSPIIVAGKLYCIDEAGQVVVIAASPDYKHLATNDLGDPSHSTPAVANGRLYLRSFHKLTCVGPKPAVDQ